MNRLVIRLAGAATALALVSPALALSRADKVIVETYRDKIAAARAEPGVALNGAEALAKASAEIPLLADALAIIRRAASPRSRPISKRSFRLPAPARMRRWPSMTPP